MEKGIIKTEQAPSPIGPYNQATTFGNFLFASGQIAIDPKTGTLKTGNIEEETHLVMNNLKAVLAEAGMDFSNVLRATIYMSDMGLYGEINKIYGSYFPDHSTAPARAAVQVAGLPKGVNVEISVIAAK